MLKEKRRLAFPSKNEDLWQLVHETDLPSILKQHSNYLSTVKIFMEIDCHHLHLMLEPEVLYEVWSLHVCVRACARRYDVWYRSVS